MKRPSAQQNATFMREAEDLLEQIEGAALELEKASYDAETVNLLFRAFHTIKGSAAMVGLSEIASFTHHVETMLDQVRAETLSVSPPLISVVLSSKDHIASLLACAVGGPPADDAHGASLISTLNALSHGSGARKEERKAPRMRTTYHIAFRLKTQTEGAGSSAADLLEELKALGSCDVRETAPAGDGFGPAYELELTTLADESALRDAFLFAPADSELHIERGLSEFVTDPPANDTKPATVAPSEARGPERLKGAGSKADTVRVMSAKLDQLVKLVGELVINQSRLQQAYAERASPELAGPVESMERLIAELRDSVFGIRMMPIGPLFSRFNRLVRDLTAQLGKEIELVTEGNETCLDKTVLDQLGDPLVHLLRNSIDHGIETPAARIARGKSPKGRILLTAVQDGGHVVITIKDDGRGLDRAAIRKKAEEKGLVDPGAHLTEQETFDLIMQPGFSTASAVTQVSGRGVGMDVVKKTVEGLRGTLSLSSPPGEGTVIRLSLPLTLAIIDGLLVEVSGDYFIVPMAAVTENVELSRAQRTAGNGRNAVAVRGELVPYVRLRELFAMNGKVADIEKVVIVTLDGQRVGLVVDRVVGSHQTVIQPLGPFYRDVSLFSGTTIMGDGRVIMILDLAGTLRYAERERAAMIRESLNA